MTPDAGAILGDGGLIARTLGEGFEARPEQVRMAESVARALEERSHLMVEAGTGVGKSFAYLVPSALRAIERKEVVVVATHTIALQEQLVDKDVPLVRHALGADESDDPDLPPPLRPVLVKGRGNYVSIRRLQLASKRQDSLLPDAASRRSLHVIEDWAYQTEDGSRSSLPALERDTVWDHVRSDSGNCMGRRCPNHNECFYQSARRRMEGANLLICNHALFFSDLALRARGVGFLPDYDHVILDEAHNVEDVAAEHFGLSITEGQVNRLLGTLRHEKTGKGYLARLTLAAGDIDPVERAIGLVRRAGRDARAFFEDLERLHDSDECVNGRIRREGAVRNPLTPAMNDLALRLRAIRDLVDREEDRFELASFAARAAELADVAEALVEQTATGCCYWVEANARGHGPRRVRLACAPVEVAPLLKERLFESGHSVVLTSATLATRTIAEDEPAERAETAFAHAIDRLGCAGARTLQLGSPYNHAEQVEVFVDRTMPAPGWGSGQGEFTRALVSRVLDHVGETDGGAFVLFTSLAQLGKVANEIEGPLAALGIPLLVQGRSGPRSLILEEFRRSPNAVLLGAASFWQGVDVRGEALRNVIITRLPFDPPGRPLIEARGERIEELGGDAFRDDALPRAVLRFKQGVGRLVRSHEDRGRVVVLDPRVVTKGYGKRFLTSLPAGVPIHQVR